VISSEVVKAALQAAVQMVGGLVTVNPLVLIQVSGMQKKGLGDAAHVCTLVTPL
jgi:hypothetical protein